MGFLKRFRAPSAPIPPTKGGEEQAVLVHLDGQGLSAEVYERYDLVTIDDQLTAVLEGKGLGDYDGDEIGEGGATLFLYGPDAERLFAAIEPTLRAYPLCRNARVVIRRGGPGGSGAGSPALGFGGVRKERKANQGRPVRHRRRRFRWPTRSA